METVKVSRKEDYFKYGGLVLLCIQQTTMPLMVRLARNRSEKDVFFTTVNVFMMDLMKLVICAAILIFQMKSITKFVKHTRQAVFVEWKETLKLAVPSLIYIFQNNVYYISLSNLEPTTFCVCYQMKIFTTAIMLRLLLNKRLSNAQWLALCFLLFGVIEVQLQYNPPTSTSDVAEQNPYIGFGTVFLMCFTSAFAGAYMEKCLKGSSTDIWTQNIRLSLYGIVIGFICIMAKDLDNIQRYGPFRGFDLLVWIMTASNSVGGLLISIVIKCADNILKSYAQSLSIIGAAFGSWLLFNFQPNLVFMLGTGNVILSIILYSLYPYIAKTIVTKKEDTCDVKA
uniref:UDP-galactose transporter n=1 Tax=Rhabditophanes sp. KR3021 TaxID=114890 RepID=A0AC35THK1_9BILA